MNAYHLVMTLTETKTYKKTITKTHRHRQIKSASKTYYIDCLVVMTKTKTQFYAFVRVNIFLRDEYFFRATSFQGWIFSWRQYFSEVNIFRGRYFWGWIFFRDEYFSRGNIFSRVNTFRVNIFQGWNYFDEYMSFAQLTCSSFLC